MADDSSSIGRLRAVMARHARIAYMLQLAERSAAARRRVRQQAHRSTP